MNLPLHSGWPGVLEAALIAFAAGLLLFSVFRAIGARAGWGHGHDVGWACLAAVVVSAGIDTWNLFYLGVVKLESPIHARVALSKIHDADSLGTRVFMELVGALTGVAAGWLLAQRLRR